MYCIKCGTELPDEADFCWKCGKPQKGEAQVSPAEPPRWETCELKYEVVSKGFLLISPTVRIFADAIGPDGRYVAGTTPELKGRKGPYGDVEPGRDDRESERAVAALEKKLVKDGWDYVGFYSDFGWFAKKFRRLVR